jgi:DNA (cytosine-5)-methyltransferase 1
MASSAKHAVVAGTMVQVGYGEKKGQAPRALDIKKPLGTTVAAGGKHAAVAAHLSQFRGSNKTASGGDPTEPGKAITGGGGRGGVNQALICAHMEQANTGMVGHDARKPYSTVVGKGCTQRIVETTLLQEGDLDPEMMARANRVARFLVEFYANGDPDTVAPFEVVTVTIGDIVYVIVDIGLRMLTPRELARAMGLPEDYILDPVVTKINKRGKAKTRPLTISEQISKIGNMVCPDVAKALTVAQFPEQAADAERLAA